MGKDHTNFTEFYCQKVCGVIDSTIEEWNEAFRYCNEAGLSEEESNKILMPEYYPCEKQCEDCACIVGEQRIKTQELIKKLKL